MPVIGIAPCRAIADYLEAVRRAGGDPMEIDREQMSPAEALGRVQGLLLTGGGDLDPALYGEAAHAAYHASEPGRDAYEVELCRAAIAADLPLLGICRGMQVINVACGGTLVQDIPTMINGALDHHIAEPRAAIAHEIWVTSGSRLYALMRDKLEGETCSVNSRHHQAVKGVAPGWEVSATAPDGVIEAIEREGDVFGLAVQWHPENFYRTGEFRPIFEGFVEAARKQGVGGPH